MSMKTLILGLGNILMGDEGIGVYTVRALETSRSSSGRCGVP